MRQGEARRSGRKRDDRRIGPGYIGIFRGRVGEPFPIDSAEVSIQGRSSVFTAAGVTNEFGEISFKGLATGSYSVFVRRQVMVGPNKKVFTGFGDVTIRGEERVRDRGSRQGRLGQQPHDQRGILRRLVRVVLLFLRSVRRAVQRRGGHAVPRQHHRHETGWR